MTNDAQSREQTDGFHLLIDALKLNGIDTIFALPGIPITDLTRKAQAEGMRVISFRHEQHAGNAAAAAGFLTQKPGICLTVSAPGFLNGLTALANATTNCFPMILISGSSEREIVDLQQGDYEEMDQLAIAKPLCKAAFRVLHAEDIGVGIARAIRSALSGRPGGVYLDLPAKLFAQTMDAEAGKKSLIKVVDPAPRQIPAPDSVQRALDLLKGAKRPLIVLGKGAAYAQADARNPRPDREDRHPLPADVDGQGPAARHACAVGFGHPLLRAGRSRRGDAGRRAPELAALAWQGQDLGRRGLEASSSRSTSRRPRWTATCRSPRRWSATSAPACRRWSPASAPTGPSRRPSGPRAIAERKDKNLSKMAETLALNPSPMNFHSALNVIRNAVKARPDAIVVNEGANTLDFARSIVDMYEPRKRLDVGTWGIMGIGMGFAVAAAVDTGKPVIAIEGDSAFGFSGMEVETICRYNLPVCVIVFNNNGIYKGTDVNPAGGDVAPTVFVKNARYEMMMQAFGGVGVRRDHPGRTGQGPGRSRRLRQADADQRHHR